MALSHSRPEDRSAGDPRQAPLLLALERTGWPHAERLRLELHAILHEHLSGITGLVSRSAKSWQMSLRGLRPFTSRDVAELASSPTREAKEATRALAYRLLAEARPALADGMSIADLAAAFGCEAADVPAEVLRDLADGDLSRSELQRAMRELDEAQTRIDVLRAAIIAELERVA